MSVFHIWTALSLTEAEAFGDLISSHKNIRHIFFGHVHRPVFLTWRGITCSACPGINHQMPLVGRAVSTKFSVEPPMYAVIEIENGDTPDKPRCVFRPTSGGSLNLTSLCAGLILWHDFQVNFVISLNGEQFDATNNNLLCGDRFRTNT